jgi:DNA primase
VPSASRRSTLAQAALRANQELRRNEPAYQYWTDERGLTDATIQRFCLGVVPEGDKDFAQYAGWLCLPYITAGGFTDIRFRRPPGSDNPAKYKGLPGSTPRLFNPLDILSARSTIHVTEGEMDAVILSQAGLPAVGIPGASNWRKPFEYALHGFEEIVVCADGDKAGDQLAHAIASSIDWARIVRFDDTDVNDYYLEHGAEALRSKVQREGENA